MGDIKLDVGCGQYKIDGYVGIDQRDIKGVDIVHDICEFPWPIADDSCTDIVMNLVWACIEPKFRIKVMDELWRVAKKGCTLHIRETHTLARTAMHDPVYYSGANEVTFLYFDPRHQKYNVYTPKPWTIKMYESNYTACVAVEMEPIK
jgi:hypothetical protein